MGYNKAGMLQAVLARFTRIDIQGNPIPGPKNSFWSDSLISISYTAAYNKQDDVSITNGAGRVCMTFSPPQTLLRMDIGDINFCYPDPEAIEFLAGGVVFTGEEEAGETPAIGYAFPNIGVDPKPFGVGMELWSSQVQNGAVTGYFHWLMPRTYLQFTKDQQLNGTDPYNTGLEGISVENPNWGAGPDGSWSYPISDRCCQWVQEAALPNYTYGYAAVGLLQAPAGLDSLAQTATSVDLTWTAVTDAASYRVGLSTDGGNTWSGVSSANGGEPTTPSTTVAGLTASTSYHFRVAAVDGAGQIGTWSGGLAQATPAV
ncbi:MAG: fibronectin type III domain-containing protein [Pseudonocardia sp.]|nr:fibronectin type III domain-containing protein [Pseudonocardia sp.]